MEKNPLPKPGPDITKARSQDEYEEMIFDNAKYFAVVEIRPGAWRSGNPNFIRTEHPTFDEALAEARRRYEIEATPKRGSLIYGVADFPASGARDMSALIEAYPEINGRYARSVREAKKDHKKTKPLKNRTLPEPGTIQPSERYFESPEYLQTTTKIVKAGNSQRALKYKNKQ
jgi:hypothetical protein